MAQIISVISGKGGTGKTSVCAGVAECLAMEGKRVLCVDLDLGLRNLDIALGMVQSAPLPFTAVMRGEYPLTQAARHPSIEGLFLLTAPITEQFEDVQEDAFLAFLKSAGESFDFILLDAPAGVDAGFRLAVRGADEAILVTHADPSSIRDAERTATLLLQEHEIPVRLVVNRIQKKLFSRMNTTIDDIMDRVGLPLLGIVPEDEDVTLAAVMGKPLVEYTYQDAALACLHIAKRLDGCRVPLMKL